MKEREKEPLIVMYASRDNKEGADWNHIKSQMPALQSLARKYGFTELVLAPDTVDLPLKISVRHKTIPADADVWDPNVQEAISAILTREQRHDFRSSLEDFGIFASMGGPLSPEHKEEYEHVYQKIFDSSASQRTGRA